LDFKTKLQNWWGIFVHLYSGYYLYRNVQEVAGLIYANFSCHFAETRSFASEQVAKSHAHKPLHLKALTV
jgi:hypothetical protein